MTADTFLFDAGSLFFAAWIAVIAGLALTAFGRDLLPSKAQLDQESHAADPVPPADLRTL